MTDISAVVDTTLASYTDVAVWYWLEDPSLDVAFGTCSDTATIALPNVRYHMSCQPQDVLFQSTPAGIACWNDGSCRNHLACHELGHTFGLRHPADINLSTTCMSYSRADPTVLRPHDEDHLEDCLPHPTPPLPTYPAETRTVLCRDYEP